MDDGYHRLKQGSPLHAVTNKSKESFSIKAIDENSEQSVLQFQKVALDAINHNDGSYEIVMKHKSTQFSVSLYDIIAIRRA
ncbi:hypothetical protein [Bradyrhizobium diazoefficiens]|uniref:Uncharacterized protein n=1 Tax=Bradyrhizobium diazoefficiens TaxID=1355477 RepID=A0A809Y6U9_9BRAD|nr:hypothetical protein [Bradyrhizobium diazoefficiens]BCA00040.1 hypothetical protein H12S4_09440 [Bradyrhizobium diazoefficiens]BCA17722.1 hypothetical protein BDHH15_09370 [Bradyrhizobium diazoefficiens]BCE35906.1 hypothetical protein XF3B_09370 [Bradyrhizobium diazoefficiens]BCE79510.1 hypothetical protein XF9B_09310 [Bradyrhizobium diazoefficiens]BCE96910.1 hypothetical protein XF11B_09310 [Bradyrhizobium diazoefficiens]